MKTEKKTFLIVASPFVMIRSQNSRYKPFELQQYLWTSLLVSRYFESCISLHSYCQMLSLLIKPLSKLNLCMTSPISHIEFSLHRLEDILHHRMTLLSTLKRADYPLSFIDILLVVWLVQTIYSTCTSTDRSPL
jgi:hypothetical protein